MGHGQGKEVCVGELTAGGKNFSEWYTVIEWLTDRLTLNEILDEEEKLQFLHAEIQDTMKQNTKCKMQLHNQKSKNQKERKRKTDPRRQRKRGV